MRVDTKSETTGGMLKRVNRELASIGVTKDEANKGLLGPTRTMYLKDAKTAAAKEQGKALNQQAIDKARLRAHLETLSRKRKIN